MEIILLQDVSKLGQKDDLVHVKDGYGRNYLIPRGFAIAATSSAMKAHAENLKQRSHKEEKIKVEAQELAAKMTDLKIIVGARQALQERSSGL
jgi:large subunit ribosomal protein L9